MDHKAYTSMMHWTNLSKDETSAMETWDAFIANWFFERAISDRLICDGVDGDTERRVEFKKPGGQLVGWISSSALIGATSENDVLKSLALSG